MKAYMADHSVRRRDFIQSSSVLATGTLFSLSQATAAGLPQIPREFPSSCPRDLEDFLKYIVQRRAADGLNGLPLDASGTKMRDGTAFRASVEDCNMAWTGAAAYRYPWSKLHRNQALQDRAFLLLDTVVSRHPEGKWDDGGLDAYFAVHSLSWAVLSWIETGDVDEARASAWREGVKKAADDGLVCLHYGPYRPSPLTGQYANPEMYLLSGLAAAWKITGDTRYREEAGRALRRYDDWLYPGGGMAYFLGSGPQHGYQHMIVKSVALYWNLTGDPVALEYLRRLAPYFPNVQHPSGLLTDAEQPQLKHTFFNPINPGAAAMIACATGDGANRRAGEIAAKLMADSVDNREPSFGKKGFIWYNYQNATYAAAALRLMEKLPLPEAAHGVARRVFMDGSFRGPRSHWDAFTAAVGTRQMNDSLAGAYLADPREPVMPLAASIDGVYFEVHAGKQEFRNIDWSPTITHITTGNFVANSCVSGINAPFWGDLPFLAAESARASEVSDWSTVQHWAVWRDALVGIGTLRCHANGGSATDVARVRWRVAPAGRKSQVIEQAEKALRFEYGGLRVDLMTLDSRGGFGFAPEESGAAPHAAWTPMLAHRGPWATGDFVNVATVIRPAGAEGSAQVRGMQHGAVTALLDPGGRRAFVWATNLYRHFQQYTMDVPRGAEVRTYKRNVEMPGVPAGEPANLGLMGGEAGLWILESDVELDGAVLLAGVKAGKTRA